METDVVAVDVDLWVYPKKYEGNDVVQGPTPEEAGLSEDLRYRVLDLCYDAEEHTEAYVVIMNANKEIYFISNRHVRVDRAEKNGSIYSLVEGR